MKLSAELFEEIVEGLRSDALTDRDKRQEPRVGVVCETSILTVFDGGIVRARPARVRDVSRNGLGMLVGHRLSKNQQFILQLPARTGEPIWLLCAAAHCRKLDAKLFVIGAKVRRVMKPEQVQHLKAQLGLSDGDGWREKDEEVARIAKVILN